MKGLAKYVASRVVSSLLTLWAISLVVFVGLQQLVPGNVADIIEGSGDATPVQVHAEEVRLGLTRPILDQYFSWLGHALTGNLGVAPVSGQSISQVISQEAPVSFELAFLGLVIAIVCGVPVGIVAAIHRSKAGTDVLIRLPFLLIYATPVFVSGALLLLASAHYFTSLYSVTYVPIGKNVIENLKVMALPALTVGLTEAGLLAQMSRAAMLEVLSQPYIVTARASGLRPVRLYGLYALKAAALPILSLIGFLYGLLIGGVIVVEQVFTLPGMGRGLLQSITNREFGELEAQVLVIAIAFIGGNLLVDLISPLFDRRLVNA